MKIGENIRYVFTNPYSFLKVWEENADWELPIYTIKKEMEKYGNACIIKSNKGYDWCYISSGCGGDSLCDDCKNFKIIEYNKIREKKLKRILK